MATTEFEEKPRILTPRNSRRNEILAILLLAVGLLLTLCLVSAAFYPSDPSWNSAGQTETRNWAGAIGANVAAATFSVYWPGRLSPSAAACSLRPGVVSRHALFALPSTKSLAW